MSISLDGFVTGPDDIPEQGLGRGGEVLHEWSFRDPATFDELIGRARAQTGCLLTGRHSYEVADGWGEERDLHRVDLELISSDRGDGVLHLRYRVLHQG